MDKELFSDRKLNILLIIFSGIIIIAEAYKYCYCLDDASGYMRAFLDILICSLLILIAIFSIKRTWDITAGMAKQPKIRVDSSNCKFCTACKVFKSPLCWLVAISIISPFVLAIFSIYDNAGYISCADIEIIFIACIVFICGNTFTDILYKTDKFIKKCEASDENYKDSPVVCKYIKDKNGNLSAFVMYNEEKLPQETIELYEKPVSFKKLFNGFLKIIKISYIASYDIKKAMQMCEDLDEKSIESEDKIIIYEIIAETSMENRDYNASLKYIDKALELNENNNDILKLKGRVLGCLEKYDQSLDTLLKLEEKTKLDSKTLALMSIIYGHIGNQERGFYYAEKAIKTKKNCCDALCAKGLMLYTASKKQEAYAVLKKSKKLGCEYEILNDYLNKLSYLDDINEPISQHFLD